MMGAKRTDDAAAALRSYAARPQQMRFIRAMGQLADNRPFGTASRVYLSVPPAICQSPKWPAWRARIQDGLPSGVKVSTYEDTFAGQEYAWESAMEAFDGLVVVGKQKRAGSRVFSLGPVARLELRTMIAKRPVLLYAHDLGLVPVVDCKPDPLPHPYKGTRLKLTVPRCWPRTSETLTSALAALQPRSETAPQPRDHLLHPFDTSTPVSRP
ncbi:hypothetical protein ACIQF5_20775 [Streptomyces goshikiensis]|uniref:hypothetical protein n=1 Tax=Streptomyces goshikiensis TaxID=1942 RepID=UPI0037F47DB0